ncbi:MAG: HlyD family type I secretion periplasmic adaptor subunit, partial [Planctomycetes bacterium]|nr:HlyD family type I secretion periplasmic adaptor subunit [Planctomycetota bacterium]
MPNMGATNTSKSRSAFLQTQLFFLLCVACFLAFASWSVFGTLDIMSTTTGKVVPSTKLKRIQHLEGGIIHRILAEEGQRVAKEDPIIELKTTANEADVNELKLSIKALSIEIERLKAEAEGQDSLEFKGNYPEEAKDQLMQAKELFSARRKSLKSSLNDQKQSITLRQLDITQLETSLVNLKQRRELLKEQIAISESLLKDQLTNRYKHVDLLKDLNSLESTLADSRSSRKKSEHALTQAELQLSALLNAYDADVRGQLKEKRQHLATHEERLKKYQDNLNRRILRSPVDGIIKSLYVATEGGVIQPGGAVADIVPEDDLLIVEAQL